MPIQGHRPSERYIHETLNYIKMKKIENYRPPIIEFTVNSNAPTSLGKFKTDDEARMFIAENLMAMQTQASAARFMDEYEKEQLRKEYAEELEDELPTYRHAYLDAVNRLEDAKRLEKEAKEMVNASLSKIQQLADEVNDGTTLMDLDQAHTWEVVHNGRRLVYTYMDKEIKLCRDSPVPDEDGYSLINSSERNAQFFDKRMQKVGEA